MIEAIEALQQLDYEETELVNQLKRLVTKATNADRDYIEALMMELNMRRKEKVWLSSRLLVIVLRLRILMRLTRSQSQVKTMETFRRVEDERTENTKTLVKEMRRMRA